MGMVMVIVVLFGKCIEFSQVKGVIVVLLGKWIDFSQVNGNGHGHVGIVRQMY